jgi:hypothetical protein
MYSARNSSNLHGENLILRAIHEVMDEKPRRSGMKRNCAKHWRNSALGSTYEIFGNLPGTVF